MAQVRNGPAVRASGPFAFLRCAKRARLSLASLLTLLLAASAIVSSPAAMAWGKQGHRITALFADTLLTPRTRARVQELTGALSLADLANWADENRDGLKRLIDRSERWHWDDRPVCDAAAPRVSYCPNGDCASAALTRFEATLADASATADQRDIALRFLVHLMADIHQPLHVSDNGDEGANSRMVASGRDKPVKLHHLWDTGFLQQMLRGSSEAAFVAGLREFYQDDIAEWQQGSERDWMNESFVIGQQHAYGDLPQFQCGMPLPSVTPLPASYARESQSQIARQLARAGARIAATLNRLLGAD